MEREFVISCGNAGPSLTKAGVPNRLSLNLWANASEEGLIFRSEDIHQSLLRQIPAPFQDLSEIAAYVYGADQFALRTNINDVDDFGGKWRRRLHFHIPVRHPELWESNEVKSCLVRLLDFLSDDHYTFSFERAKNPPPFQQYLDFPSQSHTTHQPESVVMFSGGIDSLAGVIDEVFSQRRRVVMVTHKSTAKNNNVLRELNRAITDRAGQFAPSHIVVRAHKHKSSAREYTQRTRSFLFASIGATVAKMIGVNRLRFYENGVVSLNLPICTQVVGGRATRTTHPRVIGDFQHLFSLIGGEEFVVENPYLWKTKAEVVDVILKQGQGDLLRSSISCAHTWERTKEHTHCGTCSQCIDRRFAIVAARAEELDPRSQYKFDIFTGERPKDDDKIMLAAYIERANEVGQLKDVGAFISRYPVVSRAIGSVPGDPSSIAERMLELHRRHAAEVRAALKHMWQAHADDLIERKLPPECLLRIVAESNSVISVPVETCGDPQPSNFIWERGNVWEIRFKGQRPIIVQSFRKGCQYLQYMLARPFASLSVFDIVAELNADLCAEAQARIDVSDLKSGFQITQGLQRTDLGDVADFRAIAQYREEAREIFEDLTEARANGDLGRIELLEEKALRINQAISEATDRRGKPRKTKDARKALRDGFRNSVDRTIKEIARRCPDLGEHLKESVKLGESPEYRPDPPISWSVLPLSAAATS